MAKLTINRGSLANDGTGDNLRDGANKINLNFDEIYTAIGDGSTVDGTIKIADDSSTVATISANGETLRVLGGTAITSTLSGNTLTIAADTASLITASGTATLTNKTIDLTDNTVTGTLAEFNTAVSDATLVSTTGSETLTNKTIAPDNSYKYFKYKFIWLCRYNKCKLTHITGDDSSAQSISLGGNILFTGGSGITTSVSGNEITFATDGSIVTETSTDTLTNKTINGPDNTLTNIANGSLANSSITLGDDSISLGGTQTTVTNLSLDGATGTIDLTSSGNKLRFNYAGTGSFPSEVTYEGMFAYDTTGNEAYVADAGGWTKLLNENSSVSSHADVNITGIADGNVLVWSSAQGRFNVCSSAGFTAGSDLDQAGADVQDVGYIGHRSPDATVTQTLTVTVAAKTSEHYRFGQGSSNGYLIDGHEGPVLQLSPGTYRFDQADSSNSGHPLLFYYDALKTRAYTTNVTTAGTPGSSGAYTEILIEGATPTPLYYQCSAHSYMGHAITPLTGRQARLNITTDRSNTGDGSTTVFTILADRSVDDVLVFVNGICLVPTDDYTISSTTLTFTTAPAASAEIVFRYLG
jgi:hypothetical protein